MKKLPTLCVHKKNEEIIVGAKKYNGKRMYKAGTCCSTCARAVLKNLPLFGSTLWGIAIWKDTGKVFIDLYREYREFD